MKLTLAFTLLLAAENCQAFEVSSRRTAFAICKIHQRRTPPVSRLFGILDEINSDQYNLLSSSTKEGGAKQINMNDAFEMFLAELVFSTNDPRVDIVNNLERSTDEAFLTFLAGRVDSSTDPDERLALRDLLNMIKDIKKRADLSQLAEERTLKEAEEAEKRRLQEMQEQADAGARMSTADVLRKAAAIGTAGMAKDLEESRAAVKKSFMDEELTPEIRLSYEDLLKSVLPPYKPGDSPTSVVINYYDQFDAQFVKILNERATSGEESAKAVLEALAVEQQKRLSAATEILKKVLALGDPMRMEGAIIRLARDGKIDEPFLLLLEANATQARDAGATGPAQLMDRLRKRALEEKDKQASTKEIRLIRKLLRTEDPMEREDILVDAFTPRQSLVVPGTPENARRAVDGELPEDEKPAPDVPPPDFINACKAVLLNFGNLAIDDDRGDLATRIKQIAAEAEVVATRIYGKGMSVREHQDRVWKEQTTSVWDLEKMELEAESMGSNAPWTNPDGGDDLIPGFDSQGRMQIGGI